MRSRPNPYIIAIAWTTASVVGACLAGLLLMPPSPGILNLRHVALFGFFVQPATFALLVTLPQAAVLWLLFRRGATRTAMLWIAVSVVTTVMAFFVALFAGFFGLVLAALAGGGLSAVGVRVGQPDLDVVSRAAVLILSMLPYLFGCIAAGFCIGTPQWLVLRPHLPGSQGWIPASIIGSFPMAPLIWATLYQEVTLPGTWPGPLLGLIGGAGYGVVTGAVLARLSHKSVVEPS